MKAFSGDWGEEAKSHQRGCEHGRDRSGQAAGEVGGVCVGDEHGVWKHGSGHRCAGPRERHPTPLGVHLSAEIMGTPFLSQLCQGEPPAARTGGSTAVPTLVTGNCRVYWRIIRHAKDPASSSTAAVGLSFRERAAPP